MIIHIVLKRGLGNIFKGLRKKMLEPVVLAINKIGGGDIWVDDKDPSVIHLSGQEADDRITHLSAFYDEPSKEDNRSPYSCGAVNSDVMELKQLTMNRIGRYKGRR